jgi:hypothetical protein
MFLAAALALIGAVGIWVHGPATAQTPGCNVSPTELTVDQEEQSALELINALRAGSGASALALSPSLGQAAALKSTSMAANGSFGHDDPGRSFTQRIRDCGYSATPNVAENIAAGVDTGRAVVQMWRNSPAHHRIMLDPSMKAVGLARVHGAAGWFWTANFGGVLESGASSSIGANQSPAMTTTASTPTETPGTTSLSPASGHTGSLQTGAMARVATDDGDCLNVRSGPGRLASIVICLPDGSSVKIAGGPISADGINWWLIEGLGWATGEFLSPAARR